MNVEFDLNTSRWPLTFQLLKRCPSIQGGNVGQHLEAWRHEILNMAFSRQLLTVGGVKDDVDGVRQLALNYANGPCGMWAEFRLRATKNVTDLDRMQSFLTTLFRTELTDEAAEIERLIPSRPWFFYDSMALPGDMDFWRWGGRRVDGSNEDATRFCVYPLSEQDIAEHVARL